MTLIVALPPLFWISSKKTCDSWLNSTTKKTWKVCCARNKKDKLNTTERKLLSESSGPHSRDLERFSQMKSNTKAENIIFGNFHTNHVRGSSASVAAAVMTERQRRWEDLTDSDSSIEQIRAPQRGRRTLNFNNQRPAHRRSMDEIFNRQEQQQKLRNSTKRPQSSRTSTESAAMKSKSATTSAIATVADNRCDGVTATEKPHASVSTVMTSPDAAKQSDSLFNETIVVSGDSNLIQTRTTTSVVLESNHRTSSPPMLDSTRIITKVDSIVSLNHCETTTQLNGRTLAV